MKTSGSKAKGGRIRSLHIKLPADHPVFSFPEGERSRVAREWMEQGRQVVQAMKDIKRDIEEIRKNMNGKDQRIHFQNSESSAGGEKQESKTNAINPAVFLNI